MRVPLAAPLGAGVVVARSAGWAAGAAAAGAAVGAAAVGAAAGWLVELPQAASAPANVTARVAIQIRRYIDLFLLPSDHASLVAVLPQCTCILPPGSLVWDEKSMRGSASCEKRLL